MFYTLLFVWVLWMCSVGVEAQTYCTDPTGSLSLDPWAFIVSSPSPTCLGGTQWQVASRIHVYIDLDLFVVPQELVVYNTTLFNSTDFNVTTLTIPQPTLNQTYVQMVIQTAFPLDNITWTYMNASTILASPLSGSSIPVFVTTQCTSTCHQQMFQVGLHSTLLHRKTSGVIIDDLSTYVTWPGHTIWSSTPEGTPWALLNPFEVLRGACLIDQLSNLDVMYTRPEFIPFAEIYPWYVGYRSVSLPLSDACIHALYWSDRPTTTWSLYAASMLGAIRMAILSPLQSTFQGQVSNL